MNFTPPDGFYVSLGLDKNVSWNGLGGNVALTFASQTAIFNSDMTEYIGFPNANDTNGITIPAIGTYEVTLHLPYGYSFLVYKNDENPTSATITITEDDLKNCRINVMIRKDTTPPWGKQIYRTTIN